MKRNITLASAILLSLAASAATLNINVGNVTYLFPHQETGDISFTSAQFINVLGKQIPISEISLISVTDEDIQDNSVIVTYLGETAHVTIDGRISRYVTPQISGAHVSLIQSEDVSDSSCGEITYILAGNSDNGSFHTEGSYKASVHLNGLTLTNPTGAPIDIQNGKRIDLKLVDNTANIITDGADGDWKGCLVCKGHLEFKGHGSLTVSGNTAHAIYAKEYITLKNADINVIKAVKDGLNCNQYFTMTSGNLAIDDVGDDCVQVSFKDDTDREDEDTATITITGGKIYAHTDAIAAKAIKADGNLIINGGEIIASADGNGKWDEKSVKTKAASCLSADGNISITDGTVTLSATGSGGKGINTDGTFNFSGGELNISTTGGMLAYVNGTLQHNYTGNTDRISSDYKSSPKGVKADGDVVIDGGQINISIKGNGGEGIESKSTLTINDGKIVIASADDCINSSSHMYINGGDITVVATGNDGLDSNGNLYIAGGTIRAFGARSPECGIDAAEEDGFSVFFTGGNILAVGGSNSLPSKDDSTQPYILPAITLSAGQTVTVSDGETEIISFVVPDNYSGSNSGPGFFGIATQDMLRPGGNSNAGTLISTPALTNGKSYTVSNGNSTVSATATLKSASSGRPW